MSCLTSLSPSTLGRVCLEAETVSAVQEMGSFGGAPNISVVFVCAKLFELFEIYVERVDALLSEAKRSRLNELSFARTRARSIEPEPVRSNQSSFDRTRTVEQPPCRRASTRAT